MKTETLETRPKGWIFRKKLEGDGAVYLIETKPEIRDTAFRDGEGEEIQLLKVSFPRLLWLIVVVHSHVVSVSVWWIEEPFKRKKMDTPLFNSPLPNVDEAGIMCTGDITRPTAKDDATVVDECMDYIFSSVWGTDAHTFYNVLTSVGLSDMRKWSRETLRGAKMWEKAPIKWRLKRTIREQIQSVVEDFG